MTTGRINQVTVTFSATELGLSAATIRRRELSEADGVRFLTAMLVSLPIGAATPLSVRCGP